ncbi:type II toxin-antitoxin system HipA family toxin [Cnuibacter sp. UC19_7]|uniref:type II toxin-antitoxin system HipA family toxin n=1 Tax=Cnuibacter sp. UC19_7 TaxID=3350166 RepID=UPI00366CF297
MRLAVELYGTLLGHLVGEDARTFDFHPSEEGLAEFGLTSRVLSVAMPLTPVQPRHHAARRRNWFAELLPEGDQLEYLLAQAGLRRGDTVRFLAAYGRDVAGAVQLWDVDDPTEPRTPGLESVDDHAIRRMLEDPQSAPLGNEPVLGKTSLAGVQPKIVLAQAEGGWNRVVGGSPSTHILKPWLASRPTVVYDEEYGARLGRRLGLLDYDTSVREFDGLPALVIERFDREEGSRIHQEDFNQALGASGAQKYQEMGGVVSLARIAEVVERYGHRADLDRLARMAVFTVGIGNLDLHAKNLGLLHLPDGDVRLAPAYDMVPMTHLAGIDGRVALAIDGEYVHRCLTIEMISAELTRWGLRRAREVVGSALEELRAVALDEAPLEGADPLIAEDAVRFTTNLLEGRATGARERSG